VDAIALRERRIEPRPRHRRQRAALEAHGVEERAARGERDAALHLDDRRLTRALDPADATDPSRPIGRTDEHTRSARRSLAKAPHYLLQRGLVARDRLVVTGLVGAVFEHDEIGTPPREVLAKETVVPRQLIARARAVEPEGIDDDPRTASLEHGAEQAYGAVAERLYAHAMRAIADHRHREVVGAPRIRRERSLDRIGLVDAHAQSAATRLRRRPQL